MLKVKSLAGAFSLLLVLLLVSTCNGNTGDKTVVVFQDGKTDVKYTEKSPGKTTTPKPIAFTAPSFVGGMINNKEFLAFISLGRVKDSYKDYTDGVVRTRYGDPQKWTAAEIFKTVSPESKSTTIWGDTTAVMNGDKIYVLITSTGDTNSGKDLHDPLMIVGTVTNRKKDKIDEVYIQWGTTINVKNKLQENVGATGASNFMGGEGNGIVTKKGKIIFPIVMIKGKEKFASTLYSDDGDKWLIGGETESGASDGSLVEWNEGKLLFTVASQDGLWKVFESDDFGIKWNQSPIFSAVWGNGENHKGKENPGSVIAVPVDKKDVLLFAYPQNKVVKQNHFDTLQLWLSDGQRIMCIGTISDEKNEENTGHSVLAYVGENLYITHQINPSGLSSEKTAQKKDKWNKVIGFTSLPDFFENVKTTVRAWRKLDDDYNTKGIPVNGLVGFLGNTKTGNDVWADMYNCVNATVTGGKSVSGGFQFKGAAGSGAKWPVSSQGQNQVYKFTEKQFTLAATVTIQTASEKVTEKFPLLGASLSLQENNVLIGFGYTEENKWYAESHVNTDITTTEKYESDKKYHIAITFADGNAVVYVDSEDITKGEITIPSAASISHFFIGGAGKSSSGAKGNLCTVKNVMLFSRALGKAEMKKLSAVSKDANLHTPIPTETPKSEPEIPSAALTTNAQSAQHSHKTDSTVEVKSVPEIPDTKKTMKPTRLPDGSQSLSTKKPQQTSVTNKQEIIKEITKGKGVEHALRNHANGTPKKHLQGADTAAVSFCIMPFLCFVCSVIVLAGF